MAGEAARRSALFLLGLLLVAAAAPAATARRFDGHKTDSSLIKTSKSYVGIIVTSTTTLNLLLVSFVADESTPYYDIAARRFYVGTINGVAVVIVNAGGSTVNVASAAQVLVDYFKLRALIDLGTAGSTDEDTLEIGDVVIPKSIAYTGNWLWQAKGASGGDLVFGNYNVGGEGQNSLGSIKYEDVPYYTPSSTASSALYLPVSSELLQLVGKIGNIELQKCLTTKNCLNKDAEIKLDLTISSASHYVQNNAYRTFLHQKFGASAVDTASGPIALVAASNGVEFISFRGITNYAGGSGANSGLGNLGYANVATTATAFLALFAEARTSSV